MASTGTDAGAADAGRAVAFDLVSWLARYGTVTFLLLLLAAFSAAAPGVFPTVRNALNILNQVSILGVIAFGLTVCLVMGLFDLSIAALATFGGFASTWLLVLLGTESALGVAGVVVLVLALAMLIGVINGALVSYLGISAFIETLAMGSVVTGVILGVSESQTIVSGIPDPFMAIGQGKVGGIPDPVLIMAAIGVLVWLFLEETQAGRTMYAIGGNPEAARLSGIRVKAYALTALGACASCAALGGLVAAANLGAGRPQGVGEVYLLNAFAAVFIGASTLRPGRFHVLGTLVGVLLIGVINNGLSILGVPTFWQYIVQGVLLILALISAGLTTVRRR